MPTATIVTRAAKRGKKVPLYLRISHGDGRKRYVSLGLTVSPRLWDKARERVRTSHPEAEQVNAYLARVKNEAAAAIVEAVAAIEPTSAESIAAAYRRRTQPPEPAPTAGDFFEFAGTVADEYNDRGQIATAKSIRSAVKRLAEYLGRDTLPMDAIDVSLIRGFQTHLIAGGRKRNTVSKILAKIRTVLYRAIRDGQFSQERNPFFRVSLETERVRKRRLSIDEIQAIESLELDPDSLTARVRDYFLFAFFAGGMRISDVATLRHEHIQGERIAYRMKKTGEETSIPVLPQARAILDRYPRRPRSAYVFPMLDRYDTSTPEGLHRAISSQTALVNKYLQKIAAAAGIDRRITTHLARHSLADYLRRLDWSIYDISKLLNHASIRETEKYLAGFDSDDLDSKLRGAF